MDRKELERLMTEFKSKGGSVHKCPAGAAEMAFDAAPAYGSSNLGVPGCSRKAKGLDIESFKGRGPV